MVPGTGLGNGRNRQKRDWKGSETRLGESSVLKCSLLVDVLLQGGFRLFGLVCFFGRVAILIWFCFGFSETGSHYVSLGLALLGLELPK